MPEATYRPEDLVRHATDALVAIDADQKILALNPSAELLTGYKAGEALGRPCRERHRQRTGARYCPRP